MCGIFGFSDAANGRNVIVEGLKRLEYRGYDSSGVAFVEGSALWRVRAAGKLAALDEKLAGSNPALLYTARRLGGKILYLVGNYETRRQADAELSPSHVKALKTLSPFSPAKLENGIVKARIEPDSFGLYLLEL